MRLGRDVGVRGPPPPQVEPAVEPRRREIDRRVDRRTPSRRSLERRPLDADASRRDRRKLAEALRGGRVGRRRPAVGRDVAILVPGEHQPTERRIAAVVGPGPPDHGLVFGAGQRDVREPEILPTLLEAMPTHVGAPGASLEPDVDRPPEPGCGVVEEHGLGVARDVARLPQERAVHDRKLEALAAMDGQHLYRLGV